MSTQYVEEPTDQKIWSYDSGVMGPNLLVFGAIHGNEPCGPQAITRFKTQLESREISLTSGSITMVPVCNPKAYKAEQRYINCDLNRLFSPETVEDISRYDYEDSLVPRLRGLIKQSYALLDLHSYTASSFYGDNHAYVMWDNISDLSSKPWAQALAKRIGFTLEGFGNLYPGGTDTNAYAFQQNNMSLTVECGQHNSPTAPDVAYLAILDSLLYLGMISPEFVPSVDTAINPERYRLTNLVMRPNDPRSGLTSKIGWKNMEPVKKGTILAFKGNKEALFVAPEDGMVVMPKIDAPLGGEWFLYAINQP